MALEKSLKISYITNAITIILFLSTVGFWTYSAGQKSTKIKQLEDKVVVLEQNQITSTNVANEVNVKLDLLLNYFNITDSIPH